MTGQPHLLPTQELPPPGGVVVVAGAGTAGRAAARLLGARGYRVVLADRREGAGTVTDRELPPQARWVVTSPGWRPDHPLLAAARTAGLPVLGEAELAWRLRPAGQRWLAITGTNGKTTTTELLADMVRRSATSVQAAGNIGVPLAAAVSSEPAAAVLVVELSSFQLHAVTTLAPVAAGITNLADDHLDWHGGRSAYAAAKARLFADPVTVAVGPAEDAAAELVRGAPGRQVLTGPGGTVRVVHGVIVDEEFGAGPVIEVAKIGLAGPHNLANALVATAVARAAGVPVAAIAEALTAATSGAHRLEVVSHGGGVVWINDSKATNPHAAAAALTAAAGLTRDNGRLVWIVGGLNKGLDFAELAALAGTAPLRAAVLLGSCAPQLAADLARHAAQVPTFRAETMDHAVTQAGGLASPGDVVLLAPAAASMDMFTDYAHRGETFAAAVHAWAASGCSGAPGQEGVTAP